MYNFGQVAIPHGVASILCTVTHTIESTITSPNAIFYSLQLIHQYSSRFFPVLKYQRKNKLPLMIKKCPDTVNC